jgi:hypothetical protein
VSTYLFTFPALDDRGPCNVRFDAPDDTTDTELHDIATTGLRAMGYPVPDEFPDPQVIGDGTEHVRGDQ